MSQRPLATALFLCEQIIVDEKSKRIIPVNCFSRWHIDGHLTEFQSFHALAFLTSGHGQMRGEVTIGRIDNEKVVYRRPFSAEFGDPLEQYRLMVRLREIRFTVTGQFQASLILDGECVAATRFSVSQNN